MKAPDNELSANEKDLSAHNAIWDVSVTDQHELELPKEVSNIYDDETEFIEIDVFTGRIKVIGRN